MEDGIGINMKTGENFMTVGNTHLSLTSTFRLAVGLGVISVAISITSSVSESFAGFRTLVVIELWKKSSTWTGFRW